MTPPDDRALMLRLARGDRDALAPLMERHGQRVYRIALSYLRDPDEAKDAVQETFVKAMLHAARWDTTSAVGPWLMKIAVNHSIDVYRRGKRRGARIQSWDDGMPEERFPGNQPSPESAARGRQIGERIAQALKTLPDAHRAVFTLRHYDGMSLEEIAATLGLSLGTVKSSLHRAVRRLRERLEELR